jgi:hypothetical protein
VLQTPLERRIMVDLNSFRERLNSYLSHLSPDQVVGASGLAVLCAASSLALAPMPGQPFAVILGQWLGGLGLNVLAGILQQSYQNLLSQPNLDDSDRLTRLAQVLARDLQDQADLRQEIGVFLNSLNAFQIAEEVVKGNPAVHGWLLVKIYEDVHQYRTDFDHIRETLTEMRSLIEQLQPKLPLAGSFTAPPLPSQGIFGREADLKTLRQWLALDNDQTNIPPVALRGMGGVGKTTLAIALAHLPEVTETFTDGVLWTELGVKPTIRLRLEEWGRILGIDMTPLANEEACSLHLRDALHHRRVLLIADDVWDSSTGLLFKVGGPSCRMLFTTRELPIANDLATSSRVYHVDSISPEAALALLHALVPEAVSADEVSAKQLCEKLEFHPLALTLAGRYLANEALSDRRRRTLTQRLLARADERLALPQFEKRLGIEDPHPSLRAILGLSVERLDRTDQERFAMLSLFGSEPLSWTMEAAAFVWECSEDEADVTTTRFIQRGLVERRGRRYRMHALLADYAAVLLQEMEL